MGGFGYWDLSRSGGRLLRESSILWFFDQSAGFQLL